MPRSLVSQPQLIRQTVVTNCENNLARALFILNTSSGTNLKKEKCMKKIIILAILIGSLAGCSLPDSGSNLNETDTIYHYGDLVKIKKGFYREFRCLVLHEYPDSVICKIVKTPHDQLLADTFQVEESFKKSNLSFID